MLDTSFKLYIHRCKVNGKMYVGITKQSLDDRFRYGHGYRRQPYFNNAIKKYGWNNFEHIIAYRNLTYDTAIKLEQLYIAFMHTRDKENGYNMTDGGEGTIGCHPSEEAIAKRVAKRIGTKATENQLKGLLLGREAHKKPIYCIDEYGNRTNYNSITEARDEFNKPYIQTSFKAIVNEHRKVCDRYWYYMEV